VLMRLRWVSTVHKEERPYCLPVPDWKVPDTTVEENADMVRILPDSRLGFYLCNMLA